ncbi:hypothetical protein Taro_036281, partial [Colocasia esculenta]|nr:hypothetical protein [Colocasia esculenta]
ISDEIPLLLAGCKSLEVVNLGSNALAGELNGAISRWQNLRYLSLWGNGFSGDVPTWIFSFQYLCTVDLSGNRFGGLIPAYRTTTAVDPSGSGRELVLSYDVLSPVGIDVSHNVLQGKIPDWLIGLGGLEYLNLSHNYLVGEIPTGSLQRMGSLRVLDLSHNSLSG